MFCNLEDVYFKEAFVYLCQFFTPFPLPEVGTISIFSLNNFMILFLSSSSIIKKNLIIKGRGKHCHVTTCHYLSLYFYQDKKCTDIVVFSVVGNLTSSTKAQLLVGIFWGHPYRDIWLYFLLDANQSFLSSSMDLK